jgi:hypothetical protein
MLRKWHKPLSFLMWLALPSSTWSYLSAWDQLPARMAVHFDANWRPNGYTSREGALELGIGILVVMLILFTVATLVIDTLKPEAFWPALVIAFVVVGVCWYANYAIVKFNLQAQQMHSEVKSTFQFSVARFPEAGLGKGTALVVPPQAAANTALAAEVGSKFAN